MKITAKIAMVVILTASLFTSLPGALAGEIRSTSGERTVLGVTIYNNGLAVVRDTRRIALKQGENRLAFIDTAGRIKPETALLRGEGLEVLEQNFDFDLLSIRSLLAKHLGREIGLARSHPQTGEDRVRRGTLLAVDGERAVFRIGGSDPRIETTGIHSPYRFVFYDIPHNLRDRPTLSMLVTAARAGKSQAELSYMTEGVNWSADYVGVLNAAEDRLDLKGWITLVNQSGTAFDKASLQLMAGDVRRVKRERYANAKSARPMLAAAPAPPSREKLFEYHLYTVARPVNIADRQSKQIELLSALSIPATKRYVVDSRFDPRRVRPGGDAEKLKVRVSLAFKNEKPALGMPLPAGVMRMNKRDSKGVLQFIGESKIGHTPEGKSVELFLGSAFDVTAQRRMTDYKKVYAKEIEAAWTIKLSNAGEKDIKVKVFEALYGSWQLLSASHEPTAKSARGLTWQIPVPAKGSTELSYRIHAK